MKSIYVVRLIRIIATLAIAGVTASAFAGPDWEVINRARLASIQARKATVTTSSTSTSASRTEIRTDGASGATTAVNKTVVHYR
ncbi:MULTISPECIES: hypothetical protein [Pandoraea]|uniref:hypothetical protein n=1 Tax=Pandoraea TaxID=93217 RepID=UPI001F5C51B1|nr:MULTISPECIES: hypothetical protein [Pandoraea]MCI3208059.1 hypothetical protein [Pandoraea sp. LA3]MDN4586088.1 hypothetical protein [Pandoraea capi]